MNNLKNLLLYKIFKEIYTETGKIRGDIKEYIHINISYKEIKRIDKIEKILDKFKFVKEFYIHHNSNSTTYDVYVYFIEEFLDRLETERLSIH